MKNFKNFKIYYKNEKELKENLKYIFNYKVFKTSLNKQNPTIIDCGSHIGISILYFKMNYPNAKIIGFEPNPQNFEILKKNIEVNKLKDVNLINAALFDRKGYAYLYGGLEENPFTWGDTIFYNMWGKKNQKKTRIRIVKLSSYINQEIDLIKINIEGSEQKVIEEISNKLKFVKEIILEFHVAKSLQNKNKLETIIKILEKNSFKIKCSPTFFSNAIVRKIIMHIHPYNFYVYAKK